MKNYKKNRQVVENLLIEDFASEGKCIGRLDGAVVFVEGNVAPGDMVDVEILSFKKKKFYEARVIKTLSFSEKRAEPFCQYFGTCGGCKWQHIGYEEQLQFKWQQVNDHLRRIAKVKLPIIEPILPSKSTTYYRNKLEYTFSNLRWFTLDELNTGEELERNALGFHIPKRFDRILDIEKCYLQPDPSNEIRNRLRVFCLQQGFRFYDQKHNVGFLRNLIIRTANTGDVMVIVQFAEPNQEEIDTVMAFLAETFPQITSLQYIINTKGNDSYYDQTAILYAGKPYIEEQMEGLIFRVGPKSFYQTNSEQAYELYKIAREFAQLTGNEHVYDLYTGTGTIANFVARQAKAVIGVEYVAEAIEDAKVNSEINGIQNTRFYAGDMKNVLNEEFVLQNGYPDIVITDPPRAGMDEPVVRTLLALEPTKIVYVSCNSATQARDLAWLDEKYEVTRVRPVDMFPHTHHVENVVLLEKR
ncbi:23S rRNA (uracil(1939)-C(5))-methyltransferase RlmD [Runella sp.]|jgi:23S rRNA (uracil1939-C5)-methyltransferase|uniref:23S rRNA (uracil(1939)-C(5))-methyltransferase RlmD n=1 Tax=Runella sp. TaxID=1960881 RepID=UPI0026331862|nr:23S rRNA (uracil(1939)-C(5))-methyltransferase RlmD [Runella sp.]